MHRLSIRIPALAARRPVTRHARPAPKQSLPSSSVSSSTSALRFSTTAADKAKNQIFDPLTTTPSPWRGGGDASHSIRDASSFQTYLSLSTSANRPLLTFWSASWCSTCRVVEPRLRDAVASGVGEEEGGVNYAVVVFDAPDQAELVQRYLTHIRSVPTLLAFDARRGEPVAKTRVADARKLSDRAFLEAWIRSEAARSGGGGGGGGGSTGFGGLFGKLK